MFVPDIWATAAAAAVVLAAASFAVAAPAPAPAPARSARLVRRFDWQSGSGGAVKSASGCDLVGGDEANAVVASWACGDTCAGCAPGCDHFTRTAHNGSTCWLKSASHGVDTTANPLAGAVCG
ncbi:hypothetical protein DFJ73DRAFT_768899 [Zopfochytrium polystomum]|nr:hypothetical protein DFJ73DRAFT_768899 [Zopfochytrium polystomum]